MVFSQTTHNTQNILKVVEIDRLKPGKNLKNLQANGSRVISGGMTGLTPLSSPVATTSNSEEYLKQEQPFESTMFHDPDSEFFQDLGLVCFEPAKEEQPQTIDSAKKIDESVHNTDTLHTPFSPQGCWEFDANSSVNGGFYNLSPNDPLTPIGFAPIETKFSFSPDTENEKKMLIQGDDFDISLPVVFGELASEKMVDLNLCPATETGHFGYTHDNSITDTHKMLLLAQEDSFEHKLESVMPMDIHNNIIISEHIIDNDQGKYGVIGPRQLMKRGSGLSLDLTASVPWNQDMMSINTPDVVTVVDQMEKEKCIQGKKPTEPWTFTDNGFISEDICPTTTVTSPAEYKPETPKSESHVESDVESSRRSKRRRHDSEDSDETYTPQSEHTPRKYKRRKPNLPLEKIISALEESQMQPKAKRGRPPKRRQSTVSSVCSVDDNMSSVSTQETKYRELRDKNNEASKRSRMNRKLKELQMEQLVIELEERNKKLKVKADILEDMTKRLKDALMTAILHK